MNRYIRANACRCWLCGESKRERQTYWNAVKQDFEKEIRRELRGGDDDGADDDAEAKGSH